jgi:hypothetical protein
MSENSFEPASFQKTVEQAFAPVVDAVKSAQEKIQIPESTRDFVKRSVETAQERANDAHANAEKATTAIESAATEAVTGLATLSRKLQSAAYDDATALFNSVGKIAGATSLSEAYQLQIDYLRERNNVNVARAKSLVDYLSKSFADNAAKAQENLTKFTAIGKKAA